LLGLLVQRSSGERRRRGRLGFIGSTEFRERTAGAETGRWIQIGVTFEKGLDGAGRELGEYRFDKCRVHRRLAWVGIPQCQAM
jgi:hypothetical protein